MIQSPFLTTPEAAQYLRISVQTLREFVRVGRLPRRRIGRHLLFLQAELDALSVSLTRNAATQSRFQSVRSRLRSTTPETTILEGVG